MMNKFKDRYKAITFSIICVLILRFIGYTNLFGLSKNFLSEVVLVGFLSTITAFSFYYKELGGVKRSVSFIFNFVVICIILDSLYMIFNVPRNFPIDLLLIRIVLLFSIIPTLSFLIVYMIIWIILKQFKNHAIL
jgi:hypothetical protein